MSDRVRPEVVVFDVVETLAALDAVAARLRECHQPEGLLARWFTRLVRDGMALTAAGSYAGFAEVAASALHAETRQALSEEQIGYVVAGFGELTPQPDAVPAIRAAVEAGMRVFTLSNGAPAATRGFLERAGVAGLVEQVLSIDEVGAWKPSPAPYALAVTAAGVPAEQVALVGSTRCPSGGSDNRVVPPAGGSANPGVRRGGCRRRHPRRCHRRPRHPRRPGWRRMRGPGAGPMNPVLVVAGQRPAHRGGPGRLDGAACDHA